MASINPVDAHVGGRVRLRRMERNVSQRALGAALRVSVHQIQKYERGVNRISASSLWSIAEALDAPINFFFDGLPDGVSAGERRDAEAPALALVNQASQADAAFIRDYLTLPETVKARARGLVKALCETYNKRGGAVTAPRRHNAQRRE